MSFPIENRLGTVGLAGLRSQPLMRSVNNDVRKAVRADDSDRIPFFCECSNDSCYQPLWLSLGEYDLLVGDGTFGLAPGHVRRRTRSDALEAVRGSVGAAG